MAILYEHTRGVTRMQVMYWHLQYFLCYMLCIYLPILRLASRDTQEPCFGISLKHTHTEIYIELTFTPAVGPVCKRCDEARKVFHIYISDRNRERCVQVCVFIYIGYFVCVCVCGVSIRRSNVALRRQQQQPIYI